MGALAALAVSLIALLAACGAPSGARSAAQHTGSAVPTATASPAFPAFSDWRIAYLATDGRVHVVAQDGTHDMAGPALPGLTIDGLDIASAGVSPDGRLFAYSGDELVIVRLAGAGGTPAVTETHQRADDLSWSPDSRYLAFVGNGPVGGWSVYDARTGAFTQVQVHLSSPKLAFRGWINDQHMAVVPAVDVSASQQALQVVDVATGGVRTIATLATGALGTPHFAMSPDGKGVLVSNCAFRSDPYTPLVEVIQTATGQVRELTRIEQAAHSCFADVAWKPGTQTVAVTTGFSEQQSYLLDLTGDAATALPGSAHVLGWAPDSGALVTGTSDLARVGSTPHSLSIVPPPVTSGAAPLMLTQSAVTFAMLGLVRTAP